MRPSDSGQGRGRLIFSLAILAALVYVGTQVVPAYVNNYQLADYIRDRAVHASVERTSADVVQSEVVSYAKGLGVPVTANNVTVKSAEGRVTIKIDYRVPIDLKVYTWDLYFSPSAESQAF